MSAVLSPRQARNIADCADRLGAGAALVRDEDRRAVHAMFIGRGVGPYTIRFTEKGKKGRHIYEEFEGPLPEGVL